MNKNGFWYGYLEAGDKSTAVLRDPELDTGNKKTVYLFNLARKQILEYTLAIVEPKLRGLKPAEEALVAAIDAAYPSARKGFGGTSRRGPSIPESGPSPQRQEKDDDDEFEYDEAEEEGDSESMMDEDEEEEV